MSDNYQAVYDAVRSRMGNCDMHDAVLTAFREASISFYGEKAAQGVIDCFIGHQNPSAIYKPKISIDGNMWCALYGDDLQSGVCGFGPTPEKAMQDFDHNWRNQTIIKLVLP